MAQHMQHTTHVFCITIVSRYYRILANAQVSQCGCDTVKLILLLAKKQWKVTKYNEGGEKKEEKIQVQNGSLSIMTPLDDSEYTGFTEKKVDPLPSLIETLGSPTLLASERRERVPPARNSLGLSVQS